MRFKYFIYFILIAHILVNYGCSTSSKSFLFIEQEHETVKEFVSSKKFEEYQANYISEDTIAYGFYARNSPIESIFLFENGKCNYQKVLIYCSVCAERIKDDIITDKRYKFKKVEDSNNYISKKNPNIILRMKETNVGANSCSEIQIYNIDQSKQ